MVCLETSFVIDLLRNESAATAKATELMGSGETVTIAAPSIVELLGNAYRNRNPGERRKIECLCKEMTVLPLDRESAVLAGKLDAKLVEEGTVIDFGDLLIGAIAVHHAEPVLTRNAKHFRRIPGLEVIAY